MTGYNGWKNYATWCVKLWLDNEHGLYLDMVELAKVHGDVYELSKAIENYVRELVPNTEPSMFTDLLGAQLDSVDWYEIAEHYFEEFHEEEEDDE